MLAARSPLLQKIGTCILRNAIYNKIQPKLFDVTLRDGLQNANVENFPVSKKMELFDTIVTKYMPDSIEIGSLASPKVLPIMSDTLVVSDFVEHYFDTNKNALRKIPDIYVLIPSFKKIELALRHSIKNMSFITSISDKFQERNTQKTVAETKREFYQIESRLHQEPGSQAFKKKLYVSCINQCPISGLMNEQFIINEILHYHQVYTFDELCLSDTMGTLTRDRFKSILDTCLEIGIPQTAISLHLHVRNENMENLEQILFYAFSKRINKFDVSMIQMGGCSVNGIACENLSYELFYAILDKYIEKEIRAIE